jgi:choline dehydrogenase-like flavoprotein
MATDINAHPRIDPAYNAHPADKALLAASLRFVDKVTKAPALAPLIKGRSFPDPNADLGNSAQLKEIVETCNGGTYHPMGTCAMGDVVDGSLKVKGVKNLRVIDASVFPNHVSGNICSSVYAVAECAADIIKAEYGWL